MARWEPDAKGRLEEAALALYAERGFENTTVADIADRAGLTERTFFRHFADKREVLFDGAAAFEQSFVGPVAAAPVSARPIDAVAAGLDSVATMFHGRREFARRRQAIIAASPELRERELIKLASLGVALTATLRSRGVPEPAASLTAEIAIAVFRTAFDRWIAESNEVPFGQLIRDALDQLAVLTGGGRPIV